jgi:hypothetical protein
MLSAGSFKTLAELLRRWWLSRHNCLLPAAAWQILRSPPPGFLPLNAF